MSLILKSTDDFPPGGWIYFEPKLNWSMPSPMQPFNLCVKDMQTIRSQNLFAGLSPEAADCAKDLGAYTCARLRNDPHYCIDEASPVGSAISIQRNDLGKPCRTCGGR